MDTAAGWGVPAHVTVLFPFLDPDVASTAAARSAVRRALAPVPAFSCTFAHTAWFGQDVLWLAPVPAEPFVALTRAVWAAFPETPPYAGAHGNDVVPHLTVGELRNATAERLRSAETVVRRSLPVTVGVDQVRLVAGSDQPGSWRLLEAFPLQR